MPSKQLDTVWEADPHTIAKIAVLKAYLKAWFPILGSSKRNQPVLYIDGFAGPGEYTNYHEGSPVAALTTARDTIVGIGTRWLAGPVNCFFIESDSERCANLTGRIAILPKHSMVKPEILNKTFVDGMADIRIAMPASFRYDHPMFVFIDPFGATGAPFEIIEQILKSPCSEVLINLDADGIARILKAKEGANADVLLTGIFGDDSWRKALTAQNDFSRLCREVLDLYTTKLKTIPNVRFVFPFEMRGKDNVLNYYLVFASQNPLGLAKMKEAMRSIDQSGRYCFSDGSIGQDSLFRFDSPEDFANMLHQRFVGRVILASELRDFSLLETPFMNAKAMLKVLENRELIEVNSSNTRRRRGDFSERNTDLGSLSAGKAACDHPRKFVLMARKSKIEWTEMTWNPVTGCTKVSPGCKHCYAETMAKRLKAMENVRYEHGFRLTMHDDLVTLPMRWKTPRVVFVNSMSDLFHRDVPLSFITRVFDTMKTCPQHQFQVLTKRAERLAEIGGKLEWCANIWMGVSIESQEYAHRADLLRTVPAHIRFLSVEPLLGPIKKLPLKGIHWVIVGGESGPGARPVERAWVEDIYHQCRKHDVPFFFKQWGGVQKHIKGRELFNRTFDEMPKSYTTQRIVPLPVLR